MAFSASSIHSSHKAINLCLSSSALLSAPPHCSSKACNFFANVSTQNRTGLSSNVVIDVTRNFGNPTIFQMTVNLIFQRIINAARPTATADKTALLSPTFLARCTPKVFF